MYREGRKGGGVLVYGTPKATNLTLTEGMTCILFIYFLLYIKTAILHILIDSILSLSNLSSRTTVLNSTFHLFLF